MFYVRFYIDEVRGTQYLRHENMSIRYKEIFSPVKIEKFHWKNFDIYNRFAQNIDCGYMLEPPRSTQNLCFGAKIRKIGIFLQIPVFLYKCGVQGGIHFTDIFS